MIRGRGSSLPRRQPSRRASFSSSSATPSRLRRAPFGQLPIIPWPWTFYAWLAYRLHALVKSTPISWNGLKKQFGSGFSRMDNFRSSFQASLRLALAVYRDARVSVEDTGLLLHHPDPPRTVQAKRDPTGLDDRDPLPTSLAWHAVGGYLTQKIPE